MAREKRYEVRQQLANGIDPAEFRKSTSQASLENASNSFEIVAREWFIKRKASWVPTHADKIIRRLERAIFPWIGKQPISEVTAPELLKALQRIEERGAIETAHRTHQNCGQIFRYAIATGRTDRNPAPDLQSANRR